MDSRLRVNEVFHSIQGEGTRMGEPCVFIRLTGCHLRCTYCDTEYAFHEGQWSTVDQIVDHARSFGCATVEVTGGEPLLQPACIPLLDRLLGAFDTVLLETSGAVRIDRVDPRVVRIVDFKTPSSGEEPRNDWSNVTLLTPQDEVKFVIGDRGDYEWSLDAVRRHDLARRCTVLFQPVFAHPDAERLTLAKGFLEPAKLVEWMLADRAPARLSLQIHKYIWSPAARGV